MKDSSKKALSVIFSLCLLLAMYNGAMVIDNKKVHIDSSDKECLDDINSYHNSLKDQYSTRSRRKKIKRIF